ncbi:AAA family ATPase [Riemerella anatipestifer]|uniref:AAA family ATPase n=1 Tax=Riemerella anatipestifer TaxID=34085 RepID=UPI00129D7440|nr:AAA family ATPase [Riemerella anatipestifer]MBO4233877.1 AAA family ATPase [Riemerella anatipestifer]MBT0549695.1 AAA family ATPase [Riemerella anatipestifer]MBT0556480.1 AAA family ATPase [Riemerella anatipestifer]MBT0560458.1 AAA family ATPase [Riemerella anatipestifer]MRM84906.1 AAA family ATPase [Riemerella anatipestifer]
MAKSELEIPRYYTHNDIENAKFNELEFTGEWLRHLGTPERASSILIYGASGHGKTSYALQFMKYLCGFGKVFYNTVEEGMKASFKRSLRLNNLKLVSSKYVFQSEQYDDMVKRLDRKRQPKIVFIDSVQYCFRGKKDKDYFNLVEKFPTTLFVFISQMSKGMPKGAVADAIMWDSQAVIKVEDFKAYVEKSRCGGDELTPYIINQQKAEEREIKLLKKG